MKKFFSEIGTVNHESYDQVKRQESASMLKNKILNIDKDKQSCIFQGSKGKTYQTTINNCSCTDYLMRKLPCKHIYRLAYELNIINLPKAILNNNKTQCEQCFKKANKSDNYCSHCGNNLKNEKQV